jgi:C4-dicarboxylate-specific signal transduction histidine kinase
MNGNRLDPRRWRVGSKIAFAIIVLASVPAVVLTQLAVRSLTQQAEADGRRSLRSLAESIATSLDAEIQANLDLIEAIALDSRVVRFAAADEADREALQPSVDELMDNMKATHETAGIFFILDAEGSAITSSDRAILGKNYAFRTYFARAMRGEVNVSDVYVPIGTTSPVPGTAFAAPIRLDGRVIGVATIKSDALSVSDALTTPDGLAPFIVESTGIVSSHPDERIRLASLKALTAEATAEAIAAKRFEGEVPVVPTAPGLQAIAGAEDPGFAVGDLGGVTEAVAWEPLRSVDWVAAVAEPHQRYIAAANRVRNAALLRAALVIAAALLVAYAAARMLARPLRTLTEAARRLGTGGDADAALDSQLAEVAGRRDDLGVLGERLATATRETRERERKLRETVEALKVGVDHAQKEADVRNIVDTDFFNNLQTRSRELRAKMRSDD